MWEGSIVSATACGQANAGRTGEVKLEVWKSEKGKPSRVPVLWLDGKALSGGLTNLGDQGEVLTVELKKR